MYIVLKIIANNMEISILNTIIQIIFGVFIYCLGLLILKDDFFMSIINKFGINRKEN